MKKRTLSLLLALIMVLSLAACGGKDSKQPSGSNDNLGTTSQQQTQQQTEQPSDTSAPSTTQQGAKMTGEEEQIAGFKQFGMDMNDIIPDIDGEPGDGFGHLTDPLGYGAGARYTFVPGGEATKEDCRAYVLKVMNAVKAISDDGELHGNKTNEMFDDIITEENFADVDNLIWELLNGFGFQYNGVYVDCYITADPSVFGVELAYALQ
ncbi:hypothetical protein [Dysosmobacter sp.]